MTFSWNEDEEKETGSIVHSPTHYTIGGIESWKILKAKLTEEEFRGYLKGNALKYLLRCNWKGMHDVDLQKAKWYLNKLVEEL